VTVRIRYLSVEFPEGIQAQKSDSSREYCNRHFVARAISFPMGVVPPFRSKLLLSIYIENLDVLKDKLLFGLK